MPEDLLQKLLRKQSLRAPFLLPLVGVIGCLLGDQWLALSLAVVVVAVLLKLWRILICTLLCMVIVCMQSHLAERNKTQLTDFLNTQSHVVLEGTVERTLSRGCILNTGYMGVRVVLRGNTEWRTGERVRVVAEPQPLRPAPAEGMFDTKNWMRSQGLAANLRVLSIERLGFPFSQYAVLGYAERIRNVLTERLMPPGTEGDIRRQVLCSLALGDKQRAEDDTLNQFKRGGCLHAFAVSGMHVGIVSGMLYGLAYLLRLPVRLRSVLILIITGVYVLITGLAVPALRAYLMIVLVMLGMGLQRPVNMVNIWSFSALLILMISPWQIYSAGFVLSFAVYAGIGIGVYFCMKVPYWFGPNDYVPPLLYTRWHTFLLRSDLAIRGTVIVSLSAWLASAPITMYFFHTITPYSFLTNIAISPLLPIVMAFGLLAALLGGTPFLGALLQWAALKSSALLVSVVGFFADLPMSYLSTTPPMQPHETYVCHLGYGNSFAVLGNPGIVVNSGNMNAARFTVEPLLFFSGCNPGVLLESTSDKANCGGTPFISARYPQMRIISADSLRNKLHINSSAGLYCIYPSPVGLSRSYSHNEAPVIMWQQPGGTRVLYIGSAPSIILDRLTEDELRADIVVLGHNKEHPSDINELHEITGAGLFVLLPEVPEPIAPESVPGVEIQRCDENTTLLRF
ncbi:MAG: ComEC/Rec2 family competence protein [Akkermansia sp.]|nr:ComEC/Rec2 family competence protein [Akkermansia sp.]